MAAGSWETVIPQWPSTTYAHRAIHMILVYHEDTWKVLVFGIGEGTVAQPFTTCHLIDIDDINEPSEAEVIVHPWTDLFCAGHCHLANGDVMFAGGGFVSAHYLPHTDVSRLDLTRPEPDPPIFIHQRAMNYPRWYPTCTILSEGQVMISSGIREAAPSPFGGMVIEPEIYDPAIAACMRVPTSNRHELPTSPAYMQGWHMVNTPQPAYPFMFISAGRLLMETGPGGFSRWYDTIHYWHWRAIPACS